MKGYSRFQLSRYLSEFVGTFILVASIKMVVGASANSATSNPVNGLIIGIMLMVVVYHYGYNSLAMFNPSVTIGQMIRNSETFGWKDIDQWAIYLVAQFVGGILGGFFAGIAGGTKAGVVYTFVNTAAYDVHEALFAELFFTTILVSINIHVATDKRIAGNQHYGLAIGGVLMVAATAIGPISGCAINPAVWAGTVSSAAYFVDGSLQNSDKTWIYPIAHLMAGIIAGCWFKVVYECPESNGDEANRVSVGVQIAQKEMIQMKERDELQMMKEMKRRDDETLV